MGRGRPLAPACGEHRLREAEAQGPSAARVAVFSSEKRLGRVRDCLTRLRAGLFPSFCGLRTRFVLGEFFQGKFRCELFPPPAVTALVRRSPPHAARGSGVLSVCASSPAARSAPATAPRPRVAEERVVSVARVCESPNFPSADRLLLRGRACPVAIFAHVSRPVLWPDVRPALAVARALKRRRRCCCRRALCGLG